MTSEQIEEFVREAATRRQRIRMTSVTGEVYEGRALGVLPSGSLGIERAWDDFYGSARETHPSGPVPDEWRIVRVDLV